MHWSGNAPKNGQLEFMRSKTRSLKTLLLFGLITLLLLAAPALGMAEKRVGIVYSEASANQWWDKFGYSQLFMAMQHQAMMAGIPFDVLSENDLIGSSDLSGYSALIVMPMEHATNEAAVVSALQAASQSGVGIITGGVLISTQVTQEIFGTRYTGWVGGVPADVTAADVAHPVMQDYQPAEQIMQYSQIWLNFYEVDETPQSSATLADVTVEVEVTEMVDDGTGNLVEVTTVTTETHGAAFATVKGGRNVYFVNDQIMGDTNLVWQALRWVVYGDSTPVGLKMGRNKSIFISRNDMDSSMYFDELDYTVVPLLDLLGAWKQRYNFVGSYYINIGNNPQSGEYTDWNVSGPLYQDYIRLGNEIGTHSYTHPDYTSELTSEELEFEFNSSMLEIEANLGAEVTGAAIPGNPETFEVDWALNTYFEYISGRWSSTGAGYPGGFGYLTPDYSMIYLSLNILPDYTLIEWQGNTPAQATQIWADQYAALLNHASQPLMHWLWHDYGPTSGADSGIYTVAMFEDTIAMAFNGGSEFATADDVQKRITAFQAANMEVTEGDAITVDLQAGSVGQFSLELDSDRIITAVENWYAYDDDQVFIPQDGGRFVIHQGTEQNQVTRIVSLPMRSKLISITGDGTALSFVLEGEGTVSVELDPAILTGFVATGADSTSLSGTLLSMNFDQAGTHTASIGVNQSPTANPQSVSTTAGRSVAITLSGSDPDSDPLTMRVVSNPARGRLRGTAPNLTYTPNLFFTGTDSFTFVVNDGTMDSSPATVSIRVRSVFDGGGGGGCGF